MPKFDREQNLNYYITTESIKFSNITTNISFYIREYDETIPIFKVVVDFIELFGGVY